MNMKVFNKLLLIMFISQFVSLVFVYSASAEVYYSGERNRSGYRKLKSMTPQQQDLYRQRKKKWDKMPNQKKAKMLKSFQQYKNMSPQEKNKIHQNWQKWQNMPPEKREKVLKKHHEQGSKPWQKQQGSPNFSGKGQHPQGLPKNGRGRKPGPRGMSHSPKNP